ncbi:hypothetical protein [Pelomonas sp. Root1444]|uniref:hypothetical protein n=1 Tax=Pelomonas sp. Root1444 TaxID=1736464 RepID=UPI00070245CF|nr:hypothetical protein [Pelomonas sp. Root1444]KQY88835.1 hypothetical protein ASD35_14995 [Pelomonas sp. Root1444]
MSTQTQALNGRQTLDRAYAGLEQVLPARVARWLRWLRSPGGIWLRIPAGLLCILAAVFWFMPVIGIEWLPVGLLLLAEDVPPLRKPVGRFILLLLAQARRLQSWWQARRR